MLRKGLTTMKSSKIFQYILLLQFVLSFGCATGRLQNIEVYLRQQNWPKAKTALEESVQKNPRDGEAHLLLSEVYGELDLIPQMNAALAKLRTISPKYEKPADFIAKKYWIRNFNLGNTRFEEKLYSEAVIHFQYAVQIDSTNVHSLQRYADALFMSARYREAGKAYHKALKHSPLNLVIKNNLAEVYFIEKQYEKTIALCNDLLAENENDIDALKRRAYSYDALDKFAKAEEDYISAANIDSSTQLLTDFGLLYFRHEDYQNAIARFKEALKFSNNTLLYRHLGEANWRLRNYQEMARWYRKIVESYPEDLVGWKNLAVAYEALGQKEDLAQARHYINKINSTN